MHINIYLIAQEFFLFFELHEFKDLSKISSEILGFRYYKNKIEVLALYLGSMLQCIFN